MPSKYRQFEGVSVWDWLVIFPVLYFAFRKKVKHLVDMVPYLMSQENMNECLSFFQSSSSVFFRRIWN